MRTIWKQKLILYIQKYINFFFYTNKKIPSNNLIQLNTWTNSRNCVMPKCGYVNFFLLAEYRAIYWKKNKA